MPEHHVEELLAGCSCLQCLRRAWQVEVAGECHVQRDGWETRIAEQQLTPGQARVARRLVRGFTVSQRAEEQ